MSAGKGTPRVALGSNTRPGGQTIIVTDQKWANQELLTGDPQTLTNAFETYPTSGYLVEVGATVAGLEFEYTPAVASAQLDIQIQFGDRLQLLTTSESPTEQDFDKVMEMYFAVYRTPQRTATTAIRARLEVPVPATGISSSILTVFVREQTGGTFGTVAVSKVYSNNYGQAAPGYTIL